MTEARSQPRRGKQALIVGLLVLLGGVVAVILCMRGCHSAAPPANNAQQFDYFRAKAQELHNDPTAIVAFVRDTMPALDYRGNVKGALGALWNGAASVDEKKLLAEALLAAAGTPASVSLDQVGPNRDKSKDQAQPVGPTGSLKLTIVYRIETAGVPQDTTVYDGPAGDLVGDVHSVEMLPDGKRRISLRTAGSSPVDLSAPADALGEDLIFTWRLPDQAAPQTTLRELWHRDNRTGARCANPGDRHDFVVIPCRIGAYVREKEPIILQQRGRAQSPEASAYLGLLDYALESDRQLAGIEKRQGVTARFAAPRVLILSRWVAPDLPGAIAYGIDLRCDSADFTGDRLATFRAAQVRSFTESSLENQFLQSFSGLPASAAFEVFSLLNDDPAANTPRRIAQISASLASLQQHRSAANSITFSVRPDLQPAAAPTAVQATWSPDGIAIKGGPLSKSIADRLPALKDGQWLPSTGSGTFKNIDDATLAVETSLRAADPPASDHYTLQTAIDRAAMSLMQPQARFTLQWTQDNVQTEQQNRAVRVDDGLAYQWLVQTGVLPVAGTRQVAADALRDAVTHNPWYRAGDSTQTGETSFVFSRKVYQAIKAGQPIDISMLGHYPPKADLSAPRPLDFKATLTPAGTDTLTATVNGRPEKLAILRCTLHGQPMAILDDAAYPIGMADALHSVATVVRGKIVDENNQPIWGATVRIPAKDPQADQDVDALGPTAADGVFALPPPDFSDTYGKVTLQVTFSDQSTENVPADLTAPGLGIVPIKVQRQRAKLLYLSSADQRQLDALKISDSVKRQAVRQLAIGHMVVIPNKYVTDGWRNYIAFYAFDSATGEYVGITEDGLCGSTNWEQSPQTDLAAATTPAAAAQDQAQPAAEVTAPSSNPPPRLLARAVALFHACAPNPTDRHNPADETAQTLHAMQGWATVTDIAGTFGPLTDAQLGTNLQGLFKQKSNPAVSKAEIQIGFVGTTRYLGSEANDEK